MNSAPSRSAPGPTLRSISETSNNVVEQRAFGGLDRESLRFLDGLARHGGPPRRRRLKTGTVLVRDYQGQRHTVTVVCDGFDWQSATYPSLSAIARAITGTAWSGPRFFALAPANVAPASRNKNASAREGRDGSQPARGMNAAEINKVNMGLVTCMGSLARCLYGVRTRDFTAQLMRRLLPRCR
jgi:hypothetical protein